MVAADSKRSTFRARSSHSGGKNHKPNMVFEYLATELQRQEMSFFPSQEPLTAHEADAKEHSGARTLGGESRARHLAEGAIVTQSLIK